MLILKIRSASRGFSPNRMQWRITTAEMFKKDGSCRWVRINVRTVRDSDGNSLYYEGTMLDITARKKAMAQLRESEERNRTIIEHSNDGISISQGR